MIIFKHKKGQRGQPPLYGEKMKTSIYARLTKKQRETYERLGGVNWLRQFLDEEGEKS